MFARVSIIYFLVFSCLFGKLLAHRTITEMHRKSNGVLIRYSKEFPVQKGGSLMIERNSIEHCQVRIDFDTFKNVGEVNKFGKCQGGNWTLSGQIQDNVPTLCGFNSGQHVYADFKESGEPILMNVTVEREDSQWDIVVTQIRCDDQENRVGVTCLQNYKSVNGNFQSFSYVNIQNNPDPPTTYQPVNQNYYICFGTTLYNSITFSRGTGAFDFYFSITDLVSITPSVYMGTNLVSEYDAQCTTDYVGITFGTFTDVNNLPATASKFCGLGFPVTVTSTYKPFTMYVYTDATEAPYDDGNVGFSLFYQLS